MALVRYRKLTSSTDWREFDSSYRDVKNSGLGGGGAFNLALAAAETPKEVSARELEADQEEVARLLASGDLSLRDLVFEDGRWMSFEDSTRFEDAVEANRKRGRRVTLVVGALVALALLSGLVALISALS